ncbi:MAG: hypothetical protein VX528_17600 [Candidatus Latescibacterota bacterium]|jgi:hypothetical protein|nr:hypothetical protein [Gemmatimonadota bacterium]MBI91987.1 hypothetical protein [Gemmatimonadaceae bacterium]MDP7362684.1 hypothetical protein [Candidatus Latescibacterota bacterium]MBU08508.1 hypothetical protein [Gemmatimonadota bacterium]MDP7631830.1 hypothetical protein [Candidatus Latescibacterota bacterium]|tara:strand:- start:1542 stop:1823 length:282 start_codon:yes stop_codon:yes gene_type:complete
MTDEQQQKDTQTPWIERGSSLNLLYRLLIVICLGLLVPDVLDMLHIGYHKHIHYGAEGWFAFYSIFGFIAYSLIVGAGFIWRRVVMRDEDYYA